MRRLDMEKLKITNVVNSPDLSPTQSRPIGVLEISSVTSALSNKRKRLTFSTSDRSCGLPGDRLC
jgi:hypothetical protein